MTIRALAFGTVAALAAGCGPSVPPHPTYFQDVQPILQANCERCHGPDPQQPQIAGFRLDRYVAGDKQSLDAYDYQKAIVDHSAATPRLVAPTMPPTYPLSDRQKAVLRNWVTDNAPKGERDNTPPRAELVDASTIPTSVDQTLDLKVRSWDDDGDGLWVQLFAREVGQANELPLAKRFGQGIRSVTADTGVLPSGRTFEVFAALDDGFSDEPWQNRVDVTLIPALAVDHGAKGTAPLVQLVQPNGGNTLLGTITIAWTASDPDPGDTLSIDLDLYKNDGTSWVKVETIGSGLPNGPQSVQWTPDVPDSANGVAIPYKIRVTATDTAGNVRSDDSDAPFTVAPPPKTTTLTWADVKPIFQACCVECHGATPSVPSNDYFRLDKYDVADPVPPADTDQGVYDVRDLVYQKMIVEKSMPPPAGSTKPTQAQRDQVAEWILGGAPEGGGPANAPPTVTWSTPNDSTVSLTTNGSITLRWTAVDPEGAPITGPVSVVTIFARTDALASCSASLVGWSPLSGVSAGAGTATFTKPACTPTPGSTCYWCFKVDASDGTNTTTKAALKPVK